MSDYEKLLAIAERLLRRFSEPDEVPSHLVSSEVRSAFPDKSDFEYLDLVQDVWDMIHALNQDGSDPSEEALENFTALFYDSENS